MSKFTFNVDTTDNVRLTYHGNVTSNDIILHFHTLNNNPQTNGDIIAFYEADDRGNVEPLAIPLQITPVNKTSGETDIRIKNVPRQQKSYVFAYVQGSDMAAMESQAYADTPISSLLTLPKNASGGSAYNITLNVASEGDIVTLTYTGIPHTQPQNKAWIGIWDARNLDLSKPPAFFYPITEPGATNDMELDDLLVNMDYYLGYFLNGYSESKAELKTQHLAAYIKFRTLF